MGTPVPLFIKAIIQSVIHVETAHKFLHSLQSCWEEKYLRLHNLQKLRADVLQQWKTTTGSIQY